MHNIEKAVAKHCPSKDYAVLLNKGERFESALALQGIADAVRPHFTAGLLLPLSVGGERLVPRKRWTYFNRVDGGIVNPHIEAMDRILNHFRVFSV